MEENENANRTSNRSRKLAEDRKRYPQHQVFVLMVGVLEAGDEETRVNARTD